MKHITHLYTLIFLLLMSACNNVANHHPMVEFNVSPDINQQIVLNYSPYNDDLDRQSVVIEPDSAGHATFNVPLPEGISAFDATLYVGKQPYGLRAEAGETLNVDIADNGSGEISVTFSGKNAAVSDLLSATVNGVDLRPYFPLGSDSVRPLPQILQAIDNETAGYSGMINAIADTADRSYYSRLISRRADLAKTTVMRIYSNNISSQPVDSLPEYQAIMSSINPDDEIDVRSGLYSLWLYDKHPKQDTDDNTEYFISVMELIDSVMQNPVNRRIALNDAANNFLSFIGMPKEELLKFGSAFAGHAAGYPDLAAKTDARIKELCQVISEGERLPFDPEMETPEGGLVNLSSLYGKLLYIDVWATWCGPCCAEIPHMANLYDRFRNNPGIELVSISVDEDRDAWLAKLKKDRPAWKQYRLSAEENAKFSRALNINGIPRFLIIAPDGTFKHTFAPRPSDNETAALLNGLLEK